MWRLQCGGAFGFTGRVLRDAGDSGVRPKDGGPEGKDVDSSSLLTPGLKLPSSARPLCLPLARTHALPRLSTSLGPPQNTQRLERRALPDRRPSWASDTAGAVNTPPAAGREGRPVNVYWLGVAEEQLGIGGADASPGRESGGRGRWRDPSRELGARDAALLRKA